MMVLFVWRLETVEKVLCFDHRTIGEIEAVGSIGIAAETEECLFRLG